jgi:hypothetical protein
MTMGGVNLFKKPIESILKRIEFHVGIASDNSIGLFRIVEAQQFGPDVVKQFAGHKPEQTRECGQTGYLRKVFLQLVS